MKLVSIIFALLPLSILGQSTKLANPEVVNTYTFSYSGSKTSICEKVGKNLFSLPSQYNSEDKTMSFILAPSSQKNRELTLCNIQDQSNLRKVDIFKDQNDISFASKNSTILTYVNGMQPAPEGKSELYAKSGFIHPLYSPNGTRLTRIQPSDHYHHYGIWGPWTKTTIDGEHIDFWNLDDGTGTVLFDSFKKYEKGNAYSSVKAIQHHNNLKSNETAIVEELEIKTWNVNGVYLVDYNSTFSSPLKNGILFDAYRYGGGLGFRGTEKWGTANSSVLTSEGKTRLDADGNNAKWCIIEGESEVPNQRSGILIMSHPNNRSHPEPMRVWPEDTYEGKGNVFLEFCPIRHVEWKIEPNKNYQLKYRMLVFDGHLSPSEAEAHWQAFANQDNINLN